MTPTSNAGDELPIVVFKQQKEWERWLAKHHESSRGLWLRIAKKSAALESLTYPEAVDVALCYGWIDGQKRAFDAESWLQKFTPRGARSIWSKINTQKAQELIDAGRMKPAGMRAIEKAREDGRWEAAYDSHSTSTVPPDLQAALDANPAAAAFFATLNSQNRYAILFRIQTAKRPETRAARIEKFVAMLARHEKLYP